MHAERSIVIFCTSDGGGLDSDDGVIPFGSHLCIRIFEILICHMKP